MFPARLCIFTLRECFYVKTISQVVCDSLCRLRFLRHSLPHSCLSLNWNRRTKDSVQGEICACDFSLESVCSAVCTARARNLRAGSAAFCLPGFDHFVPSTTAGRATRPGRPLPGRDSHPLEQQTFHGTPGLVRVTERLKAPQNQPL